MISDMDRRNAIEELELAKSRLPEKKRTLPVVANLYKNMMSIDDIILEIENQTPFGNNFVLSNMIRLKQYPQIKPYSPKKEPSKEEPEGDQYPSGQQQ